MYILFKTADSFTHSLFTTRWAKKIWFGRLGLDVLQNLLVGFHKINKCSSDYGYDYGNSVPNNDLIVIHASWSGMITVNSFVGLFDTFESNGQRMKRKDSERFPCEGEWLFMATHLLDSSACPVSPRPFGMLQKSTTGQYWLSLAQFMAPALNNPSC